MHLLILAAWSVVIWALVSVPAGIALGKRLANRQPADHCPHTRTPGGHR